MIMYIARFDIEGETWLQALIGMPHAYSETSCANTWSEALKLIIHGLLRNRELRPSYRLSVDKQSVTRTIFLSVPERSEADLRRTLASFTRLTRIADNSACLSATRREHDGHIEAFPCYRCMLSIPEYRAGNAWLACDFNLQRALPQLITEANLLGYEFTYHINFEPLPYLPHHVREASRNLLRLCEHQGASRILRDQQEVLVERLKLGGYLAEELLGAGSTEVVEWLRQMLRGQFNRDYGPFQMETQEFDFQNNGFESSLVATRHRCVFDKLTTGEIVSQCVNQEKVEECLAWVPPKEFCQSVPQSESVLAVAEVGNLPVPYAGMENYIFVSYKREDMHRMAPVLRDIAAGGHRIWFDQGIPAGAEWDSIIEERLEHCMMVLLFVSQAAIGSRYVRREVKFADALNKPVLSIRLENTVPSDGMKMLLNQYQIVDVDTPGCIQRIQRAIHSLKK